MDQKALPRQATIYRHGNNRRAPLFKGISFNGGMIVRPDLTVIEQRLVPADAARKSIHIIQQHGLHPWLWTAAEWYILDPNGPHVAREQHTVNFLATTTNTFEPYMALAGK